MSKFVFYHNETGEITKVTECNEEDAYLNLEEEESFVPIPLDALVSDTTHYVNLGTNKVTKKKRFPIKETVSLAVGEVWEVELPEPFSLLVTGDGENFLESNDNTLQIEFDTPGKYSLCLTFLYHITNEVIIDVYES